MLIEMQTEKPEDIEMTLTVTMKLGEWLQLAKQTDDDNYPGYTLVRHINSMATQAKERFYSRED